MVVASLIATIATEDRTLESTTDLEEEDQDSGENAEMTQYLNGEALWDWCGVRWNAELVQANTRLFCS